MGKMTINSQRLFDLQERLERLLTEKKVLNSKVISDAYDSFKSAVTKVRNRQAVDIKSTLKRLESCLKSEGAYKNVKTAFEEVKTEVLQVVDSTDHVIEKPTANSRKLPLTSTQKLKNDPQPQSQPKTKVNDTEGKGASQRATTVTISQQQARQKRQAMPAINRPVIKEEPPGHGKPVAKGKPQPLVHTEKQKPSQSVPPMGKTDLSLLNRTISRLFHHLEIDKKSTATTSSQQSGTTAQGRSETKPRAQVYARKHLDKGVQPKASPRRDAEDLPEIKIKLEKFEKQLQDKLTKEQDELKTLHSELQTLRMSWSQQEKQLERLKGTHMIASKAKGKHVELIEERHLTEKRDIEEKLLTLEENIRKNMTVSDSSSPAVKQDMVRLKTEILRVHKLLANRTYTPSMASQHRRARSKMDTDDLSDMIKFLVMIGNEIEQLQGLQTIIERHQNELKMWNTYVHDVDLTLDDFCQDTLPASEIAIMDNEIIRIGVHSRNEQEKKTELMKFKIRELKKTMTEIRKSADDNGRQTNTVSNDLNVTRTRLNRLMDKLENSPNVQDGRSSVLTIQSLSSATVTEQFENSLKKVDELKLFVEKHKNTQDSGVKVMKDVENDFQVLQAEIDNLNNFVHKHTDKPQDTSKVDPGSTYRVPKVKNNENQNISKRCQILVQRLEKIKDGVQIIVEANTDLTRQQENKMQSDGDLQTIDKQVQEVCDWLNIATKPDEQHTVETITHKLSDCKACLSKLQEDFSSKDKSILDAKNQMERVSNDIMKLLDATHAEEYSTIQEVPETDDNTSERSTTEQIQILQDRFNTLIAKNTDLESQLKTATNDSSKNEQLKESEAKLKLQVTVREQELREQNTELHRLREDTILKNTENTRLQLELNDRYRSTLSVEDEEKIYLKNKIEDITRKLDMAEKSLNEALKEKYGLLTRLSAAAGTHLFDGTVSIWDHSDPYRPIKMAERYSDVFDNEWRIAHQTLKTQYQKDEKEIAKCLLEVITEAFSFCTAMADIQLTEMHKVMFLMHIEETKEPSLRDYVQKLSDEDKKQIMDIRKWSAPHAANKVTGLFISSGAKFNLNEKQLQACEGYVSKCVETCWLMSVQTPPLHLSWNTKSDDKFEHTKHRQLYHAKGWDIVDQVVWPALHIIKQGDILCKAVVKTKKMHQR